MRAANDRGDEDQPGAPGGYRSVLSKCWRRARPLYPAQPNYFFSAATSFRYAASFNFWRGQHGPRGFEC